MRLRILMFLMFMNNMLVICVFISCSVWEKKTCQIVLSNIRSKFYLYINCSIYNIIVQFIKEVLKVSMCSFQT